MANGNNNNNNNYVGMNGEINQAAVINKSSCDNTGGVDVDYNIQYTFGGNRNNSMISNNVVVNNEGGRYSFITPSLSSTSNKAYRNSLNNNSDNNNSHNNNNNNNNRDYSNMDNIIHSSDTPDNHEFNSQHGLQLQQQTLCLDSLYVNDGSPHLANNSQNRLNPLQRSPPPFNRTGSPNSVQYNISSITSSSSPSSIRFPSSNNTIICSSASSVTPSFFVSSTLGGSGGMNVGYDHGVVEKQPTNGCSNNNSNNNVVNNSNVNNGNALLSANSGSGGGSGGGLNISQCTTSGGTGIFSDLKTYHQYQQHLEQQQQSQLQQQRFLQGQFQPHGRLISIPQNIYGVLDSKMTDNKIVDSKMGLSLMYTQFENREGNCKNLIEGENNDLAHNLNFE
jgi:hypothetical protein